jgi:anthranilate phosphoribosyltransferase
MQSPPPSWFTPTLETLLERRDLGAMQMSALMHGIVTGACGEGEAAALLVALRMKGETGEELAAAAGVLREYCIPLVTGRDDVLDTCGTGGDGTCTFNISTAAALVAAGAGAAVVKHGNRAVSGRTGSADVLAALGVSVECDADRARLCLERAGMAFCLAPVYHPCLQHVGALRRRLGVRTMFNCLGPLANPARAPYQLLGVGRKEWLEPMAHALAALGVRHGLVVCGHDGLDEVTLSGTTWVREVVRGTVRALEWTPADFGLQPCRLDELKVADSAESAAVIRGVLKGDGTAAGRVVRANVAAALLAAERVGSLQEGVARADLAIETGAADRVLVELVLLSEARTPG